MIKMTAEYRNSECQSRQAMFTFFFLFFHFTHQFYCRSTSSTFKWLVLVKIGYNLNQLLCYCYYWHWPSSPTNYWLTHTRHTHTMICYFFFVSVHSMIVVGEEKKNSLPFERNSIRIHHNNTPVKFVSTNQSIDRLFYFFCKIID